MPGKLEAVTLRVSSSAFAFIKRRLRARLYDSTELVSAPNASVARNLWCQVA